MIGSKEERSDQCYTLTHTNQDVSFCVDMKRRGLVWSVCQAFAFRRCGEEEVDTTQEREV